MRIILITAYAVDPYKGSEEGTGWNLICQASRNNFVIAVTRKNNAENINRYIIAHRKEEGLQRIQFLYFDLPAWTRWWKKGPLLAALYFYMWQLGVAIWLRKKDLTFHIAHSLNFHANWTPSFLWMLGKPFVWGPVGNHPLVPRQYILKTYGLKAFLKDRMLWVMKWGFWNIDPFVRLCSNKAGKIFYVNSQTPRNLSIPPHKSVFMPAVASEKPAADQEPLNRFTVLSVGRFVPLKGFDLAISAFAAFYRRLPVAQRYKVDLQIIGKGPEKERLQALIREYGLEHCITILEWLPRNEVITRFRSSSVFLFPSHEGAGMVVPEAMSYGVPVVCLDNFGPGEYVHPNSKLKVVHGDYIQTVDGLADKLETLFIDPVLFQEEKQLAKQRFDALFRWKVKQECMDSVYDQLHPVVSKSKKTAYVHA